jgi:myo-inositol-1(or 4)-monophosphatase
MRPHFPPAVPEFSTLRHIDPLLELALSAAQSAGALIRSAASDPAAWQIRAKRPNDFVTQVDLACEQAIVKTLLDRYPGHAVRGEEAAKPHGSADADHVWIVDPLDGTNNFIHGYPAYSVSIALSVRGRIEHAVVLDAVHGDVFNASLGGGAFCNDRPLRVGSRATLPEALVGTSCPFQPGPDHARCMQMFAQVMAGVAGIRRSGSAALDLAWVAAGYCDAFFDLGLKAWDVAAAGLLVTEAGGRVGDFAGTPDFLETQECMAGNVELFAALGALLRPYSRGHAAHA